MIQSKRMSKSVGESRHPDQILTEVLNQFPAELLRRTALAALSYSCSMTHKAGADEELPHGCPQGCMPDHVRGFLKVHKYMIQTLLVQPVFLTKK